MKLFEELIEDIKTEYHQNANHLGWRFLHTSKTTLERNNGILFITLNPGGNKIREDQPMESCEDGCAYLTESWKNKPPGTAKLQRQFQHLFKAIADNLGNKEYTEILESSVCAHFIPFRSPSLAKLQDRDKSTVFANNLWNKVLLNVEFQLIICIDKVTYKSITKILSSISYTNVENEKEYPIEWGEYKSLVARFEKKNKKLTLVWFPHPSKFSIFGREKSLQAVDVIVKEALKDYKPYY